MTLLRERQDPEQPEQEPEPEPAPARTGKRSIEL